MKTSITRYIVRNAKGEYQSAYSTKLGNDNAFKYATLTARDVFGVIYSVDTDGNEIQTKPILEKISSVKNAIDYSSKNIKINPTS